MYTQTVIENDLNKLQQHFSIDLIFNLNIFQSHLSKNSYYSEYLEWNDMLVFINRFEIITYCNIY